MNEQHVAGASKDHLPFQRRVVDWMMETFSMEVCRNTTERNHRFLEEALELVQAMGCTPAEAHMLVDYVFGRPVGDPEQEVGGAMVTLAALCAAADISMAELAERELARCWVNIDRIRFKQAGKPRHSPLPGPTPSETRAQCSTLWKPFDDCKFHVPCVLQDGHEGKHQAPPPFNGEMESSEKASEPRGPVLTRVCPGCNTVHSGPLCPTENGNPQA